MEKDIYKTSRFLYVLEAAFEYFINILLGGAYIAKVTTSLGMNDGLTGIITSIVSLASTFQIVAIFLAKRKPVKRWVTLFHTINQLFFASVYLVPFFNFSVTAKMVLFIVFFLLGHIINQIINAPKINWFMSLVDDKKRGSFTATKEMVSLLGGMTFTFIIGSVMDHYETVGNNVGAFIFCSLGIFALTALHTCTLIFSKEKSLGEATVIENKQPIMELLKNKNLLKVIFISSLWQMATYMTTPFYGTYQIKELGFTMTFISVLSIIFSLSRVAVSKVVGKFADKSYVGVLKFCFTFGFLCLFIQIFTVPANGKVFYIIYYVLYAVAMSGIDNCEMNLVYGLVNEQERVGALALRMTIKGLTGFLTTLAISPLVNYIQANGNKFFGFNVYAQQVVSALGAIVVLIALIYLCLNKDLEKQKS